MLYAIGNHDDAIFGNYKHRLGYTKDAGPDFYPIGQRERFMRYFNEQAPIAGFSDKLVPLPADYDRASLDARWAALDVPRETEPGIEDEHPSKNAKTCDNDGTRKPQPGTCQIKTYCDGFDLNGKEFNKENCQMNSGYYGTIVPGDVGTRVQLIALNTTKGESEWGADAAFDEVQRLWLQRQLAVIPPPDVTIVFQHHRPSDLPSLVAVLNEAAVKRPLVVLSGHTHSHETEWHGHFWEVNTGSLEEFPQWARLVEIRFVNHRYYLNARVLQPDLSPLVSPSDAQRLHLPTESPELWDTLPEKVKKALIPWFEEQFVACDTIAGYPPKKVLCSQDPDTLKKSGTLLHDSARCGYVGALYDHIFVPYSVLSKASSQTGHDAAVQANVIVDISP